jgi:hypothetical protein
LVLFAKSRAVERWNLSSVPLLLSLFLKIIQRDKNDNYVPQPWALGHSFGMCLLTLAQKDISFSSYHLKDKYVELKHRKRMQLKSSILPS